MSDSHDQAEDFAVKPEGEDEGWAIRPAMLALIGLVAGYLTHLIIGTDYSHVPSVTQMTLLTALIVGAGLFGLTVERRHLPAALVFALVCAAVASGIVWWNGNPDHWGGGDGWRMFALAMALAIAAPLFQSARDAGGFSFSYPAVHDHAWTNIVLWVACWVFVGITWALAWLLAALFQLIEIDFVKELLMKEWFARCLIGLAFGGGLGLLREHGFVVRLLQRVVTTVLAVLAPVLAVGLVVFLLALPFTGLTPLWNSKTATVILLVCAGGAAILANAVIGTSVEQARRFPLLRYGAMALGAVILPLAVIASIAIGLRINQYGYTPERLWALTFVVIASAFGVAYLVSLVRGRLEWAEKVRPANLVLAFALCGVALVLATPLISFNAISTNDQVARLESGKLTPEKFDWRALAFDFGEPGKKALARLSKSPNAGIRAKAVEAAKAENRWDVEQVDERVREREQLAKNLRILPAGTALPEQLRDLMLERTTCYGWNCTLAFMPGATEAVLLQNSCFDQPKPEPSPTPTQSSVDTKPLVSAPAVEAAACGFSARYTLVGGMWIEGAPPRLLRGEDKAKADGYAKGEIQIRPVERRQVFVGGVPIGDAFE